MSIIDSSNKNNQAFKGLYANLLSDFAKKNTVLPTIALESTVIAGRTYHANKRGGNYEFEESFLEEFATAGIWFFGITGLNKLSDKLFKTFLKLDTSVDWGIIDSIAQGRLNPDKFKKTLIAAKVSKLTFSVITSLLAVGLVLPKLKQKYTKTKISNEIRKPISENYEIRPFNDSSPTIYNSAFRGLEQQNNSHETNNNVQTEPTRKNSFNRYDDIINTNNKRDTKSSGLSFKGTYEALSKVGYALDNVPLVKLSVVDTGITGGRVLTARNKDEGFEFFFRDVSSWPFYLFTLKFVSDSLAKTFDKHLNVDTKLDPKAYEPLSKEITKLFINSSYASGLSQFSSQAQIKSHFKEFQEELKGLSNEKIIQAVKNIINIQPNNRMTISELEALSGQLKRGIFIDLKESFNIDKTNKYLTGLYSRAKELAVHNSNSALYDQFRKLDNLIDDLQKTNNDVIHLAEKSKALNNFLYHHKQTFKPYTTQDFDVITQLVQDVKAATFDNSIISKIDNLYNNMRNTFNNEGFILHENLDEVVKGGITRNSGAMNRIFTFLSKGFTNPTKDIESSLLKELTENISSNIDLVLNKLHDSLNAPQNISRDESIVDKFASIGQTFKNKALSFKTAYLAAGFIFSAVFLAIIIPRTQQKLTRLRTGHNQFPGVSGLLDNETSTRTKGNSLTNKMQDSSTQFASRTSKSAISEDLDSFMQKSFIRTSN